MSLATYKKKRHFDRTTEPRGGKAEGGQLRFVVQKHAARHLHYDFRLQVGNVLKSWAVPKGPSLDPADRRLAVMVEDHPLDYRTFEGIIPEGNYGAGSVMDWDEGTYTVPGISGRRLTESAMTAGLSAGRAHVVLKGKKLRGEFTLVRMNRGDGKNWLLMKKADDAAVKADVTANGASVKTGRTLAEIAASRPSRRRRITVPKAARKGRFPHAIRPMLATPVAEPFDRPGWLFEVKWDGYRAIAEVESGKVSLYSRNHNSFNLRFAPIVESLEGLGHDAVLDGEVVVVDDAGRSSFQLLQNYQKTGQGRLVYYVFDMLYLDGKDLRPLPLLERKEILAGLIGDLPRVRLSEHVTDDGIKLFGVAAKKGLEGIIAKDAASPYREGRRGGEWLKIKTQARQEAVIGGFTKPRGSRTGLGALLLGVYEGDDLVYIGHTGGGLNGTELEDLRKRLDPLVQQECPFRHRPRPNAPVRWVEPMVVCEVKFKEWTADGIMRQPIFVGLREDKPAKVVCREEPRSVTETVAAPAARRGVPTEADDDPPLTHPDKVLWPADHYTKRDLAEYYRSVSPVLLPYLRDRPLSLLRHPNGIDAASFFQKDVARQPPPDWVETTMVRHDNGRTGRYIVCQDAKTLLYLANLACIELNPWNARIGALDRPDYLVIDLDPEATSFTQVIKAAVTVRRALETAGAPCYCKTSGKTGLHIYVPLAATFESAVARQFAEVVANIVNRELPDITSVVRSPALRQRRVYLDYLQNRYGQTVAAPYSVRPVPGATVSTPLSWTEVGRGLDPHRFTIRNMAKRLDKVGDLWGPVLGPPVDLEKCLSKLAKIRTGKVAGGKA